jgi:hypothetical protein
MLFALTVLMAVATITGATVDLIMIRWHYQDRKQLNDEQAEIVALQNAAKEDEAEIARLRNER